MKYSISELAKLAGISPRTLRYYDQIGLLKPKRQQNSNYRYYDSNDVDLLQQILFYKEMGVPLNEIKKLMQNMTKEARLTVLYSHLNELNQRKVRLNELIENVTQTIKNMKGEIIMSDEMKFKGLKEELLKQNERLYKEEVIQRWGQDTYIESSKAFSHMTNEQFDYFYHLASNIITALQKVKENPSNEELKHQVVKMHQEWLTMAWGKYDQNAHLGLVSMYVQDERFKQYYDQHGEGLAQLLYDLVHQYLGNN